MRLSRMWIGLQGECQADEAQAGTHWGQSMEVQLLPSGILAETQPKNAWENPHKDRHVEVQTVQLPNNTEE